MPAGKAKTQAERLRAIAPLKRAVERALKAYKDLRAQEQRFNRAMNELAAAGWKSTIPHRHRF